MASPGGTSSGSSTLNQISSPDQEEELQAKMNERKRKRMESNRESARRSRMKKQQHLDEFMAEVAHLRKQNSELATKMSFTTQNYMKIEAENSVLRAQVAELSSRLLSLDEIMKVSVSPNRGGEMLFPMSEFSAADGFMASPWNSLYLNQPMMATADMF